MTRKEAIFILANIDRRAYDDETNEALDIAINSVEIDERYELEHENAEEIHKGRWVKISPADIYECSTCGQNVMTQDIKAYKFCHGCGAKMEGGQNDN